MRPMEWKQLIGKILHGSILSLIGDEQVISLQRTKFYVFSDSLLCLGKTHENTQWNYAWEQRLVWLKHLRNTETKTIDGEPMECEWNIFQGFTTLHLSRSQRFTVEIKWDTREFQSKDYHHVDVQRHLMEIKRQQSRMRVKCQSCFSWYKKRFGAGQWSFSVMVQRKSDILSVMIVHKVNGTKFRKRWCWHSQKADTQSSVPEVHCPEVISKVKAMENCRYTKAPIWTRLKLFFAKITSVN